MSDELVFANESESSGSGELRGTSGDWKVLIVDDQSDVHKVTRLVLDDFAFEGRKVTCMSAYSGEEAKKIMQEHPDVAVMLLDVVMETNRAGLEVARYVRAVAKNQFVRIILRTGEPGEAPEREVVTGLDINDYRQKTELTSDRLVTAVTTAIRSYRDLKMINDARRGLHLLAMSVAHQIRNRTIAIAGFANIIKRKGGNSPETSDYLGTILEESSRLEHMVNDVTKYASISLGEMQPSDIRELIETATNAIDTKQADLGGVVWEVLCPNQMVMVDPELFIKAFEAILQNSVDFSEGVPQIKIRVAPSRMICAIEVQDSGTGINEDDMPHIYDPFFSLKPKGSGMGLCIVRKVAMEHQWDVHIDSTPGEGTLVEIIIPRRDLTGMGS
ncbi:Sensor histidine kinase/response regulator [Pseudodesulfovibrio piezophilus C1TLV30]|uniref:histidine kinase n=2 Tax=Pseudodesulfovibrio TaxID=2035811 RepID=M1WKY3_PSEP2|nr:Sensor histidine kinase/response regulator [Pseudodesulfovibrio piezophilus C1TLV30]